MTASAPTAAPTWSGGAPAACAWCEAPLDAGASPAAGRLICARCGAATTDPWPTESELEAAYGDWYRPEAGGRFGFGFDALLGWSRGLLASRLDAIAPAGRILDVGAGEGTLVDALRARGREAIGTERGAARDDFFAGSLRELDPGWAGVVMWHSLEHLPEPRDAVRQAARLLAPGGVLAIAVPNCASLQARAFGDRWLHLDIPRHLVHLPAPTLLAGLTAEGFEVERVSYVRGGQLVIGWLDGLVGGLPGNLRLYQALRRRDARSVAMSPGTRAVAVAAAVVLTPLALAATAGEVALRKGGTVYVEARRG